MRAADQLEAKIAQIEVDHPSAAPVWVERIVGTVDTLEHFPLRGRPFHESLDGPVRELVIAPYRVLYRLEKDSLVILSVRHSREEISPEDLRPDYP